MTHLMRLLIIGALAAGTCTWVAAQDDIDALLAGFGDEAAQEEVVKEDEPATEAVAEEAVAEEAVAEEPAAEEATEEAVAEEPAAEEAVAEEPAAEKPAAEEPAAEKPAAEEPAAEEPAAEKPAAEKPAAEEPAAEKPTAEKATAEANPPEGLLGNADEIVATQKQFVEEQAELSELAELEKLRVESLDKHGLACLRQAQDLLKTKHYVKAIEKFEDAQKYLRVRNDTVKYHEAARKGIRHAMYLEAKDEFVAKHYPKAKELAEKALNQEHPNAARLLAQIQLEMDKPVKEAVAPKLPTYAQDNFKADRELIRDRIKRATVFYHVGNYKAALEQIELVLRSDINNAEAISLRARIARRLAASNEDLKSSTHDVMIAQVNENWTPRGNLAIDSDELGATKVKETTTAKDVKEKEDAKTILNAMEQIRLPELILRAPATLVDAIDQINELSKTYDTRKGISDRERGISFVLNLGNKSAAAAATKDDPFAAAPVDDGIPKINALTLNMVTLREALDTICSITNTKFIIKNRIVMIVPVDQIEGKMVTRTYNVVTSAIDKINTVAQEAGGGGGGGGWGDAGGAGTGGDDASSSWKKFFIEMGVPFKGEAKVGVMSSLGKLRVTNTEENLALVEQVLEEINVVPTQIEVEARFVEVSQKDLNSLGFEWQLNNNLVTKVGSGLDWADLNGATSAGGSLNGAPNIFNPLAGGTGSNNLGIHGGQGAILQGNRFLTNLGADSNLAGMVTNDQFAMFSGVFGKLDISMILHMLSQRTDSDMLSSPKVLTKSGNQAVIKVVEEIIYPTEYDVEIQDTNNNNNNNNMGSSEPPTVVVEPQNFETREAGVILDVTPEVSPEGQMINLLVSPTVVELRRWLPYNIEQAYPETETVMQQIANQLLPMQKPTGKTVTRILGKISQPVFHTRGLTSMVSVYNGATVVMGGLITETRKVVDDKVPFLGDLPFVGFLFRSQATESEKRNLLIFLTARLVDPAGRPVRAATDGAPVNGMAPQATETIAPVAEAM